MRLHVWFTSWCFAHLSWHARSSRDTTQSNASGPPQFFLLLLFMSYLSMRPSALLSPCHGLLSSARGLASRIVVLLHPSRIARSYCVYCICYNCCVLWLYVFTVQVASRDLRLSGPSHRNVWPPPVKVRLPRPRGAWTKSSSSSGISRSESDVSCSAPAANI